MVKTEKIIRIEAIPEALQEEAEQRREALIDVASMFSDELMEAALEGRREQRSVGPGAAQPGP